jgi:hypothetical protein
MQTTSIPGDAVNTGRKQRKKLPGRPFEKGVSGNPAGRPPGARNRYSEEYINDFHDVWRTHGKKAIVQLATKRPADFVRIGAAILSKQAGEYDQENADSFLGVLVALGRASRSRDDIPAITLEAR